MTKTKKALVVVLALVCTVCLGLFTLTACKVSKLDKIEISKAPDKVIYIAGESFDATGMEITAKFEDGSTTVLTEGEYALDIPEFTLSAGQFEGSKNVKISYTHGKGDNEVTKTANQTVKVTNKITAATIKTQPETTEYYLGQTFNPTGLVLSATLEDGTTKDIEVTKSNATFSNTEGLTKADKKITVTIGGFDIDVEINVLNALYVEAETGYRDGALIEQSTGDTGNLRTDSTTEAAQAGAKSLYEAHLKAQFAAAQMKEAGVDVDTLAATLATPDDLSDALGGTKSVYSVGVKAGGKDITQLYTETVKWLKADDNKEAVEEYLASDEYTAAVEAYVNGTNEDKAQWDYVEDVKKYTAHAGSDGNEYYLGQNNQGNVISFVFDSSANATGKVNFRLSNAYLYADSGWTPIIMGDIQFNRLCEFYVNGVKQNIPDEKILYGGMTEDGSTNQILWVNWDEVQFDNVGFVEGRNVIELRILNHGISAQEGYNFAANIDTLIVLPNQDASGKDTADLNTYDNSKAHVDYTINSITLSNQDNKMMLNIAGAVDSSAGYVADLLDAKVGSNAATLNLGDTSFTVTADVTKFNLGNHELTIAGEKVSGTGLTISDAVTELARNRYKLAVEGGNVVVNIDSDYAVTLKTATVFDKDTVLDLKLENDRVIYTLTGSYEAEFKGYDLTNEVDKADAYSALAELLQGYFTNFRFESKNNWQAISSLTNKHVATVVDETTFTLSIDVTALTPANGVCMNKMAAATNPNSNGDYKPACKIEGDVKEVILGDKSYKMWIDSASWTLLVIQVTEYNPNAQSFKTDLDGATLKVEADKIYMVITGTSANYDDADALKAAVVPTSAIDAEDASNGQNLIDLKDKVAFTANTESGNYTITVDITDLAVAKWWMHFGPTSSGKVDVRNTQGTEAVTCGGKTYQFLVEPQDGWTAYRLNITAAAE